MCETSLALAENRARFARMLIPRLIGWLDRTNALVNCPGGTYNLAKRVGACAEEQGAPDRSHLKEDPCWSSVN
ncbi:MAG TPA: hypothetical protein VEH50_06540 [Methylomirabilota bacterium]|nr:hypothetical protein [Methylomirabilota bacterium]